MKYQVLFSLKKQYLKKLSAAVVIGALKVKSGCSFTVFLIVGYP